MRFDLVSLLVAFGITLGAFFGGGVSSRAPAAPGASVGNMPPQCVGDVPGIVRCNGGLVTITLDATASYDPENDPLSFAWFAGCPSAVIADPQAALTTMTVDTAQMCGSTCSLRLTVSDGTSASHCRFFIDFEELEASFNVGPGVCPNTILVGGGDDDTLAATTLPTSLLGSKAFDPTHVENSTIQLSRAGSSFLGGSVVPISFELTDVGTPIDLEMCECNPLGGDGILDLLIEFDLDEVIEVLGLDAEPDGTVVPLEITGQLVDGTLAFGLDCVVIAQGGGGPICPGGVSVELWPPNHGYHALDLDAIAGVTDPSGLPITIEITGITQDEPVNGSGDGNTVCDGTGVGTSVAHIRAERRGSGNGRVYRVSYTATNSDGASCDGSIEVTVPKSMNGDPAVDDGQLYDSTDGC